MLVNRVFWKTGENNSSAVDREVDFLSRCKKGDTFRRRIYVIPENKSVAVPDTVRKIECFYVLGYRCGIESAGISGGFFAVYGFSVFGEPVTYLFKR